MPTDVFNFFEFYLQIGEYIASNGGVVTAEELAPYLDLETTNQMVFLFLMIYSLVVVLLLLFCNACLWSFLAGIMFHGVLIARLITICGRIITEIRLVNI